MRTLLSGAVALVGLAVLPVVALAEDEIYVVQRRDEGVVLTNIPPADGKVQRFRESHRRPSRPAADKENRPVRIRPYTDVVRSVASRYGVDPNLVHAVISVESGYDPGAVSPRGAVGLMQLMPETAAELGVHDLMDPHDNIVGGVRQLRRLLDYYDGDLSHSLAAYNAGVGAVDRHGGIPPYRETVDYIRRVRRQYRGDGRTPVHDGDDPIYRYVDREGTVVFTQFPASSVQRARGTISSR
jgi:hypothetical protein